MTSTHFIPASTSKIEGIAATGKGISIAPACGGSVEAQIERSTHLIAQRLGCSPQAIQKLAGLQPSASKASHVYEIGSSPKTGRRGNTNNKNNSNNINDMFGDGQQPNAKRNKMQQQTNNPMIASVKKEIDEIKPLSLPPLPQQFQSYGGKPAKQQTLENDPHHGNAGGGKNSARGGLTVAQQQAAFLDDAEAARQFAAQLRYREAMLEQRKIPGVGQYNIPSVVGADRSESIYARAPHVSLDGQTPRSGRFMFNVDLFENGAKRPGPGEYFHTSAGGSAFQKTIAGRDRGMRKKLPIERVNARMNIDMKSARK